MSPSAAPARAPRLLFLVALLAVLVALVAVHANAAAATATATAAAGRLASRLAPARPAAAAAHSPTQTDADRRFQTKWVWKYYYYDEEAAFKRAEFPACTSEINGTTHAVISAEQWPRINFNPTNDDNSCRGDGGFASDLAIDAGYNRFTRPFCQAKCKGGYVNTAPDQLGDGVSKFRCDYPNPYKQSINDPGTLSGGPTCFGPKVVGLAEGQPTAIPDAVLFHMELEGGLNAEIETLVIAVSCIAEGHSLSGASLNINVGASRSGDVTLIVANNDGGSCTFTYASGDARFIGWTNTINFVGATLTASLTEGSTVLTGSANSLVLTASNAVDGTLTANVRCADSANAEVGTLAATTFSFSSGNTAKTLVYTMPSQLAVASAVVTCKFTSVVSSDARYNNFAVPDLVFTLARQTLIASSAIADQVLLTNSPTTLTLTASAAPTTDLTVTPTCSAGTVSPATFVINSGASTATVTFTAPAVKASVSCTFALAAPTDDRFVGIQVAPIAIAVDLPLALSLAAANPFITGTVNPVTVLISRAAVGTVGISLNTVGNGNTVKDGEFSLVWNLPGSAQPGDFTPPTYFAYSPGISSDKRYVGVSPVYLEPPRVFVAAADMIMTASAATGSAALIGGRQSEMSVTLSYAAFDSLMLTPRCLSGSTVVGSFSPSAVSFVDGATVASINYTAPTFNVATLVCSFIRQSGDYRYNNGRSASLPALQVIMPTITLSGLVNATRALSNGDSLFVGDEVALLVSVTPAPAGALTLAASRGGVTMDSRTVDSGATAAQKLITITEAGPSEWSFAYESGDDRFAGISSNSLGFSAVLTTLTASVSNGSVTAASALSVTLTASHAVRGSDVVVHISCDGGAAASGSFRVHVGQTLSTVTEVTLPAAAAAPTTVTCALWFDRGDARYSYASAPSFFVVVPAAEPAASSSSTGDSGADTASGDSDSSTADSGSSTGTGTGTGTDSGAATGTSTGTSTGISTGGASGASASSSSSSSGGDSQGASSSTGKNECDDAVCAATTQAGAHSGFALLALAAAAAFALSH